MKTDIIKINSNGDYLQTALDHIEGLANVQKLSQKDSLYLRLLAEEAFTLFRGITGDFDAEFWAEGEGDEYKIVLAADVVETDDSQKEKLISLATSGENSYKPGIMAKVGTIFEFMLKGVEAHHFDEKSKSLRYGELGIDKDSTEAHKWSLSAYKANATESEETEELEKSIVANVADDIVVSAADRKVRLELFKKF